MLSDQDARTLSKIVAEPGLFPEARQQFTRELLDYYKALLSRNGLEPVPAVRRMW